MIKAALVLLWQVLVLIFLGCTIWAVTCWWFELHPPLIVGIFGLFGLAHVFYVSIRDVWKNRSR